MFNAMPLALGLLLLAGGVNPATARLVTKADAFDAAGTAPAHAYWLCSADDHQKVKFITGNKAVADAPAAWIGVRLAPVPEPLAAHLQREGLMIANIVIGSPADQAGLERYDVVVSFNGQPIQDLDDLRQAIDQNGAGQTAQLVVIHAGQERSLEITPIQRDPQAVPEFKYAEPEAVTDEPRTFFWGNRLRPGPDGQWLLEPFGRMDNLPDRVKEFLDRQDMPDFDWQDWADQWQDWTDEWPDLSNQRWRLHDLPFGIEIEIGDDGAPQMKGFGSGDDKDVSAEIRIKISEDGKTIEIHRSQDGKIDVKRTDADGKESSATYEGLDQLRDQDEEACEVFTRQVGPLGYAYRWRVPDVKTLHKRQQEFQKKVKQYVDQHAGRSRDVYGRPLPGAGQGSSDLFTWLQHPERHQGDGKTSTMKITIGDDGQITVETIENGASKTYEFNSRADFQAREPQLYERLREHLE